MPEENREKQCPIPPSERNIAEAGLRVPTIRISPNNENVLADLGLLADLAGTWQGCGSGFNLIARPDQEGKANLYLQLNTTTEILTVTPIGSPIPNRGFGQPDITLHGLTYLQKIADSCTGGAMHIEPGIWITQPPTSYPTETTPIETQIIARMGSIPHGNALLAQGIAERFNGNPTLPLAGQPYAFSRFPSFNSTPFPIAPAPAINAAGSNEKDTAANVPPPIGPVPPFTQYDITIPEGIKNPRTPYNTNPPDCPWTANSKIDGVPIQKVINDPIILLQTHIEKQIHQGHTFEGVVLNIATQANIQFLTVPNKPASPTVSANMVNAAGGIENILFLEGGEPTGPKGPNADTATVYATFWIEKVKHHHRATFMQLQYAQMVVLNFGVLLAPPPPPGTSPVILGWPHISVATLTKSFN
ncbi:heme-binding protein [Tunturiibacter empetritectus]|uniref:Uncharacterized protein n=1 Tax=Tunturiibacter lichenicola TaxID=2051959 RepID=A0A852VEA6_9BACT|nr:heme-binding protein [Edaphobacter lichenicola]NYF87942.1 hypothetical protein [Edaphobacter lichenicola]